MERRQLEHLIRAASAISGDDQLVIVGSQSVLGQHPDAPEELLRSMEADLYPHNHPDRADLIDGSIGEESPFHETFGYYAQGVAPTTAVLPRGWEGRLTEIRVGQASGFCIDVHDLALSKYVAGREKDREFTRALLRHGMVRSERLLGLVDLLPVDDAARQRIREAIARDGSAIAGRSPPAAP